MRLRLAWIVGALGLVLLVAVAFGIFSFGLDWKAWIGWRALVDYINPKNATGRKDAVQVYALMVAGVVAAITAAVGLLNLRLTRKNLEQQRELETQRAQGTALQTYYEQIGNLITEYDLRNTERKEVRELARGQTWTVLQEVDGKGKASLLTFLYGAGLVDRFENPAVSISGANFRGAHLQLADLRGADLQGADLSEAYLPLADLSGANLSGANLREAEVTDEQLDAAQSLQNATMPDGTKHP